jgi:repressor LexA
LNAQHSRLTVRAVHRALAAGPQNLTERIIGDTWVLPIGDTWDLPKELVGDGILFRLRIRGDSMINAAIADGDIVTAMSA